MPTITVGQSFLRISWCVLTGKPPKKLATFTAGMYVAKRSNSPQICMHACQQRPETAYLTHAVGLKATHLVSKLSGMADDNGANLALLGLQLLQDGQHEHSRLAHARLGLAQHVHAQNRLGYAFVLHCALKPSVSAKRTSFQIRP